MNQPNSVTKADMTVVLDTINKVEGFDPAPFAVDYADLTTGETRKRLPAVIQIAWFRLKYPEGRISVSVAPGKDCFVATARVYPSYKDPQDAFLAEATVSRGVSADKPSVSPREWAQTAAIGVALRNAGFGVQFAMAGEDFSGVAPDELGNTAESGKQPAAAVSGSADPVETPESEEAYDCVPPTQAELTPEEKLQNAMRVSCPIQKYNTKTLGDVLTLDPKALNWLATKYSGSEEVRSAAQLICEYAVQQAAE